MSDLTILPLTDRPDLAETCAAWGYGEWGCYEDARLEKAIEIYEKTATNLGTDLPFTWVGIMENKITGMVSLRKEDHDAYKNLSPWLASLYVHPYFRGRGYAHILVQHVEQEARKSGYETLYLYTPDMEILYQKNGWENIERKSDNTGLGRAITLMKKNLVT